MTFEQVRCLDEALLRRLLAGPDAVERLWAVWALALRQGAQVVATHTAGEPSDGVRRRTGGRVNQRRASASRSLIGTKSEPSFIVVFDVSDPDAIAYVADQASRMILNEDGVRSFALRRTAVDVLVKLQTEGAFLELRAARDGVAAALAGGSVPPDEVPLTEDLLARIEAALSPYFD